MGMKVEEGDSVSANAYEQIRYETRGAVALVTLNRPDRLNAWTAQMSAELVDAITAAGRDDAIGAIVMTGAGRGFCAGADMSDTFQKRIDRGVDASTPDPASLPPDFDWVAFCRSAKPLIAAVNGASVGVGLTMILPFDLILASENARFAMAFVKVGLVPELASTHFLVQRMGFGRASEMCLSGRLYGAEEAFALGLVERVVPAGTLLEDALACAEGIAANPGPQLGMIKELLTRNGSETDLEEAQRREGRALRECWSTPEHKEAVQAFLEKRSPRFR